jgi:chemotaxis protein methyltransferase CheR
MGDITAEDVDRITMMIRQKHGYDFRNYALSSFKRRVIRILELHQLTVDSLLDKLHEHPSFINEFVGDLTVNVTEMFRDHLFWTLLRGDIIPQIRRTRRQFSLWHAGCSSGEEVLSMVILLAEMGVLDDVTILASDLDSGMVDRAREGNYPLKNMAVNDANYALFKGAGTSLAPYYNVRNKIAEFDPALLRRTTFRQHDLVTGDVAERFDLILCRNVMIYFNQALQNDVLKKFHKSLHPSGYLAIGSKESLVWCDIAGKFSAVHADEKIYRKIAD